MSDPTGRAMITLRIGRTWESERVSALIIRCPKGAGKDPRRWASRHGSIVTGTSFTWSPSSWSKTRAVTVYEPGAVYM